MKNITAHIYTAVSAIAIIFLYNDLKETSEELKMLTEVVSHHQKALESHKVVIEAHDGALGLVFDHFENTFL